MQQMVQVLQQIPDIEFNNSKYLYDNKPVPRVTEILSSMLHEEYLMDWANNIGRYQHISHVEYRDLAASIGTYTHEFIENFLKNNTYPDFDIVPQAIRYKVKNTFNAFLKWWNIINKRNVEILMIEHELICKYFGGTLDLLIKIDDKIYLVDFKTSNHPSYKYTLQLSAYRYMLIELYNINVDGCIILMLDKQNGDFKEIMYYLHIEDNINYFNYCQECFLSLVYAYYYRTKVENMYNSMEV